MTSFGIIRVLSLLRYVSGRCLLTHNVKILQQKTESDAALWARGVALLGTEFSTLSPAARAELVPLLAEMGRLKEEIVLLSDGADGSTLCTACNGACCRVGRYHPTFLDLLACIAVAESPVEPDFATAACPFLGSSGCRIVPSRRPFTCVIFICELIAEQLPGEELTRLARLEEELRHLRRRIAVRFGGRLAESFFLEMERSDRDGVPVLTPPTDGGSN